MIYAIGDIHGCFYTLRNLLNRLPYTGEDTMIFLGDYIDRGYYSKDVLDLLIEMYYFNTCIFCKGNHEDMLQNVLDNKPYSNDTFFYNGGLATISSFGKGGLKSLMAEEKYTTFLSNLVLSHETDDYIFVHAGLGQSPPYINSTDSLWVRNKFIQYDYSFLKKKIIFGHTPFNEPLILKDKIGIDTGCIFEGKLTCLILPEEKFVSVPLSKRDLVKTSYYD